MTASFNIEEHRVVGLLLDNGTEIWPPETFHGRSIETPEDRRVISEALATSSGNLGISPHRLLEHFRWLVRVDKVYTTSVQGEASFLPISTPELLSSPEPVNGEASPEDGTLNEPLQWVGVGPDPRGV